MPTFSDLSLGPISTYIQWQLQHGMSMADAIDKASAQPEWRAVSSADLGEAARVAQRNATATARVQASNQAPVGSGLGRGGRYPASVGVRVSVRLVLPNGQIQYATVTLNVPGSMKRIDVQRYVNAWVAAGNLGSRFGNAYQGTTRTQDVVVSGIYAQGIEDPAISIQ